MLLPILLLGLTAFVACSEDQDEASAPLTLPASAPTESPKPLTAEERKAIDEFEGQLQVLEGEWDKFYQEFDDWRLGLTTCHPSSAQEVLRGLAASYTALSDEARNLPRDSTTHDLADLVITATEAEEAAFRQLRDRWQAGNISFFEIVEQRRAESAVAQNAVADMSIALEQELMEAPTFAEVAEMDDFSETFDGIADAWDDFHDAYTAFAKRESKLEEADRAAGYVQLVEQLNVITSTISAVGRTEINRDVVDALEEAAEDEQAALQFLADFPPDLTAEEEASSIALAQPASAPPSAPVTAPATDDTPPAEAPTEASTPSAPAETAQTEEPAPSAVTIQPENLTPLQEMAFAIQETVALVKELEQSIDDIVNDKSAENLVDLEGFDVRFRQYVVEWTQFYEVYNEWRATGGGCDRVEVTEDLAQFSRKAGEMAGTVRDLPQSGFLLPVYSLTVEAAERESGAIRTLSNSWTPFAVDVFKAADQERVDSGSLRRQAGIALEELRNRP